MCAAIAQIVIKEDSGYGYRYEGQVNQDEEWHGLRHGKGVASLSSGERYVGEFRYNCCHGHGTMTDADGRVKSGKWDDSEFLG